MKIPVKYSIPVTFAPSEHKLVLGLSYPYWDFNNNKYIRKFNFENWLFNVGDKVRVKKMSWDLGKVGKIIKIDKDINFYTLDNGNFYWGNELELV